jgi:hypothetical protein
LTLALTTALGLGLTSFEAEARPRDDMRAAYDNALRLFNDLELDAAITTVDTAISNAQAAGAGQDPTLASLYLLKAALIYSNEGDGAADRIVGEMQNAAQLNYYVVIPVEVRSEGLVNYLAQAQARVGSAPSEPIQHTMPEPACGTDLVVEALLGVPDGGLAALYWRPVGGLGATEFKSVEMTTFSNVADYVIPAAEHGDMDIEYFIFAFDANNQAVANKGTQEDPMLFTQGCGGGGAAPTDGEDPLAGGEEEEGAGEDKPKGPSDTLLPRVWINLGVGTGFGIARGTAEQTYAQYFPRNEQFLYSAPQASCAIARWFAGDSASLPSTGVLYGPDPANPQPGTVFDIYGGGRAQELALSYNPNDCSRRHPVKAGMAPALFHIAPEIQIRVAKRLSIAPFARLQVVTGSSVYRDDPSKAPGQPELGSQFGTQESENARFAGTGTSYWDDVYTPNPQGVRSKTPFTWAVGLKIRYYLLDDMKKMRLFVGGFGGYGQTRLRVDMGFADDRNGNSVPDDQEVGADAIDSVGTMCYPVWPYQNACPGDGGAPQAGDNLLATSVAQNATAGNRIDTVKLGPGFVGVLFGFNYQVVKNFAIYGELDVGLWLNDATSALFDLTVGPAISF